MDAARTAVLVAGLAACGSPAVAPPSQARPAETPPSAMAPSARHGGEDAAAGRGLPAACLAGDDPAPRPTTGWPAIESLRPAGLLRGVIDDATWGVRSTGAILYVSRTASPVRPFVLSRDGARIVAREIALPDAGPPPDAFVGVDHVVDGAVVRMPMSGARAFVRDGLTLAVRSDTRLLEQDYPGQQVGYVALHRDRLVLGTSTLWDGRTTAATTLIDAATGALVARIDGMAARAAQGGCVLANRGPGEVVALDLAGAEVGALRFATDEVLPGEIVAAGRRIAALSFDGEMVLLDAAGGRELMRRPRPGTDARVWLAGAAGGRVLLAEERPDGADSVTELVAISIDDGRELWRSAAQLHHVETDETPFVLATDEDAIVVCAAGVLRALDPATGAELFQYGDPAGLDCRAMVAVRPDPDGPSVIAAPAPPDVRFFARGGRPLPLVRTVVTGSVRIAGRPAAGARLRIGRVVAVADHRGSFHAAVAGRGALPVELLDPREAPGGRRLEQTPLRIRLAPGRVAVTVRLRPCDDCD